MKDTDAALLYGSAYLIQESTPVKLIGSIVGGTRLSSIGKVTIGIFEEDPYIMVMMEDNRITVRIQEEMALEIAKRILHVAAQNRAIRKYYGNQNESETSG